MNGQIIRRREADSLSSGDPHDVWYRYNGVEMGTVSNNGSNDLGTTPWTTSSGYAGVTQTSYKASINSRTAASAGTGAFRNGSTTGTSYSDFDRSYEPINSYRQGSAGGRYTVQGGETLQAIAQAVWGDASLWYKLAEANGLSADAPLVAGQTLTLPSGTVRTHNNASTFKPYDTAEAIGNVSPTTPKPPKNKKCGFMGAVLLVAIAVAVSIVTAGAAAAALTPGLTIGQGIGAVLGVTGAASISTGVAIGAGVVGGAVGSIVSQGVGVATGLQDKFSWKAVALAGLAGGIGAGLGPGGAFGPDGAFSGIGSKVVAAGLRGATASALTQGIGVITGLQKKFDWVGVAAAGAGASAGQWVGGEIAGKGLGKFGERLTSGMAGGIANAATRSLINGTNFGDNLIAALPDAIGQTIGGIVADAATGPSRLTAQARAAAGELDPTILDDPERFAEFRQTYKDTRSAIRNLDLGDDPYANANALADTYAPLLSYAADQQAAGQALAALRTPSDTVFSDLIDGAKFASLEPVTVTGRYRPTGPALGLKLLDSLAIQAGNLGVKLGDAYGKLPLWARYGITALGFAVDAAAGPIGFALRRGAGYLMGKGQEAAATAISARFLGKGYSPVQAALGGAGALLVGSLVFAGAAGARKLLASGVVGRLVDRTKNLFRSPAARQAIVNRQLVQDFGIPRTLNPRQQLHLPPVGDGRSVLTADPSDLLTGLHDGAYKILRDPKPGQVIVDFGSPIGEFWNNGVKVGPSQFGVVTYGKKGAHIYPANPNQW